MFRVDREGVYGRFLGVARAEIGHASGSCPVLAPYVAGDMHIYPWPVTEVIPAAGIDVTGGLRSTTQSHGPSQIVLQLLAERCLSCNTCDVYGNDFPGADDGPGHALLDEVEAAEAALRDAAHRGLAAGTAAGELQAYFDAVIAADQKIEPRDWMPDAYRRDADPADRPARALRDHRHAAGGQLDHPRAVAQAQGDPAGQGAGRGRARALPLRRRRDPRHHPRRAGRRCCSTAGRSTARSSTTRR